MSTLTDNFLNQCNGHSVFTWSYCDVSVTYATSVRNSIITNRHTTSPHTQYMKICTRSIEDGRRLCANSHHLSLRYQWVITSAARANIHTQNWFLFIRLYEKYNHTSDMWNMTQTFKCNKLPGNLRNFILKNVDGSES